MRHVAYPLALAVGLALCACSTQPSPTAHVRPTASAAATPAPAHAVRELQDRLVGKSMTKVVDTLGEPTEVYSLEGGEAWHYANIARDSITGRPVKDVEIIFAQRTVASLDFSY